MVYYVRFLKLPKADKLGNSTVVTAVITVTTDLGESFFNGDITLVASLHPEGSESVLVQKNLRWRGQNRVLDVELRMRSEDVEFPVRLHVGAKGCGALDDIHLAQLPEVVSIWSGIFDPSGSSYATHNVQRRFAFSRGAPLLIWEESQESIARHIW